MYKFSTKALPMPQINCMIHNCVFMHQFWPSSEVQTSYVLGLLHDSTILKKVIKIFYSKGVKF